MGGDQRSRPIRRAAAAMTIMIVRTLKRIGGIDSVSKATFSVRRSRIQNFNDRRPPRSSARRNQPGPFECIQAPRGREPRQAELGPTIQRFPKPSEALCCGPQYADGSGQSCLTKTPSINWTRSFSPIVRFSISLSAPACPGAGVFARVVRQIWTTPWPLSGIGFPQDEIRSVEDLEIRQPLQMHQSGVANGRVMEIQRLYSRETPNVCEDRIRCLGGHMVRNSSGDVAEISTPMRSTSHPGPQGFPPGTAFKLRNCQS